MYYDLLTIAASKCLYIEISQLKVLHFVNEKKRDKEKAKMNERIRERDVYILQV